MGDIDFSIPSILISSVEKAMFHKYVFASAVYVLKVSYIWTVHFLYTSANSLPKNIRLFSERRPFQDCPLYAVSDADK